MARTLCCSGIMASIPLMKMAEAGKYRVTCKKCGFQAVWGDRICITDMIQKLTFIKRYSRSGSPRACCGAI